jgi:hypothetical protein
MLVSVAGAHNEAEAQMICGRLAAEGIEASARQTGIPQTGTGGAPHEILVEEADAERAREALAAAAGAFTDEELAALAEAAGDPPRV